MRILFIILNLSIYFNYHILCSAKDQPAKWDYSKKLPISKTLCSTFINLVFLLKIGIYIYLSLILFHSISLKYGCALISSASPLPDPNLFAGFLYNNYIL